uniref:peroxiredoxin-like family protein n=1 Tax=Novacetimonas labruscae TaxID=3229898 RepID=UPI003B5BF6B8
MNADHFTTGASLRNRFLELENERKRSWAPEALAVNVNQRAALVAGHGLQPHVVVGDTLPPASLATVDGHTITLDELSAQGPAVLVFFRFAGCPACNIALPHYRDTLWPALRAAHIPLVAISPQPPALLKEIVSRHDLPFPVATDSNLALSRALGITYVFDAPSRSARTGKRRHQPRPERHRCVGAAQARRDRNRARPDRAVCRYFTRLDGPYGNTGDPVRSGVAH